jgi:hypothetical protein
MEEEYQRGGLLILPVVLWGIHPEGIAVAPHRPFSLQQVVLGRANEECYMSEEKCKQYPFHDAKIEDYFEKTPKSFGFLLTK